VGKDALTERAVWQLVREYAAQIGIGELAPHDLRRTAAKLCRAKGGELEQINKFSFCWGMSRSLRRKSI
jgi:site-specific recombinase XerD